MSSKPAPSPEILRYHEEAFTQHYKWLMRWALQFTNNDRTRAEDLVQEVFAQFAFAHTDLSAVQNVPAYLYRTLRNTYVSEVRMAGRTHVQSQSIIDYGIADVALGAGDPLALYQLQDQLRRVCEYACVRKQSSRAGSVLILRFFHGYHISEVAEVLGCSSQAVRQCLRFARNEARLFLDDPNALTFINRTHAPKIISTRSIGSAEELLADLRLAIFSSCEGECLSTSVLGALDQKGLTLIADNLTLAHVVSCRRCLDEVNRELGLPILSERHPADALGPDNSRRGGPGSSGGAGGIGNKVRWQQRDRIKREDISRTFLLRCQRRARELFEHYPRELCVSVNGHLLGSQSVNSDISRLRLDITIAETLSFIEVMSEENARLLIMNIDAPPDGEPTQTRQVALSEGRRIEATLRYGHPWPMLEVVYEDPNFMAELQLSKSDVDHIWELNPAKATSAGPVELEPNESFDQSQLTSSLAASPTLLSDAPAACTAQGEATFSQRQSESASATAKVSSKTEYVVGLIDPCRWLYFIRRPLWSRPGFITGILSLFLIGALLFVRINVTPTVSAASLLEWSSDAETRLTRGIDQATHRIINLEERNHSRGDLIATSRIDIWRDGGTHLSVRRVYDGNGDLIAGEWAKNHSEKGKGLDGGIGTSRTIYHRGGVPRTDFSVPSPHAAIRDLEVWQLEPSASVYAEMIGRADEAQVSESPLFYVVSYTSGQAVSDSPLLRATLKLRKSDLHAIEQTLIIQRGSEVHEYRFVEVHFERPSVNAVAPKVFEVDPELLSEWIKRDGARTERERDPLRPSSFIPESSVVATPELEVEVAYLLDQFRVRFGDQINLTRTPDGGLAVQGTVDTEETRQDILRALLPVVDNPAVRIRISTVAEALDRQRERSSSQIIVQAFNGPGNAIPVYPELHRYFLRQRNSQGQERISGSSEDDRTDQVVRAFAVRVVGRSRRALSSAIELKQLSSRFSRQQLDQLSPSARTKLFSMVRSHAEALRREISLLTGELQPIFFPNENMNFEKETEISSDDVLTLAIERLYKLVLANDETVRSAFAASQDPATSQRAKEKQFYLALVKAEKIADSIQQLAAKSIGSK